MIMKLQSDIKSSSSDKKINIKTNKDAIKMNRYGSIYAAVILLSSMYVKIPHLIIIMFLLWYLVIRIVGFLSKTLIAILTVFFT